MFLKTVISVIALALVCLTVKAQVWTKTIGTSGNDLASTILSLQNGDFLMGGSYTSPGDYYNGRNLLIRVDKLGNVVWTKYFGLTDNEGNNTHSEAVVMLKQAIDGNVLVLGRKQLPTPNSNGSLDIYLAKFTPDGDELWRHDFDFGSADIPRAFVQTTDGGYAVAAYTTSFSGNNLNSDVLLLKLHPDGTLNWLKTFDKNDVDDCGDILEKPSGELVVVGTSQFQGMGNRFYLFSTDAMGELIWEKSHLGTETVKPNSATLLPDGSIYAVGNGANAVSSLVPIVAKLSPVGDLAWVTSCGDCQYGEYYGLLQCQEGGSFAVGMGGSNPFDGIVLQQLAADGDETWSSNLFTNPDTTEFALNATWASDGGILVLGNKVIPGAGYDVLIMKFNGLECTPAGLFNAVPTLRNSNKSLQVFPNPSNGLFQVNVTNASSMNNALLKIANLSGYIVHQQPFNGRDEELNLSDLPKGLYFIWLEGADGSSEKKKVVVD